MTAATATTAAVALTAVPVLAAPPQPSTPADSATARARVDRLHAQVERAVEAFNAAAERVTELEDEVERRRRRVARGQQAVNEQRRALGSAAAAQYRTGAIDPSLALLLTTDPDGYLQRAVALDRAGQRQSGALSDLVAAERTLERRRTEAEGALAELTDVRDRLARHKRTVQRRLAAARRGYERLEEQERRARERSARARSQAVAEQPRATRPPPAASPRAAAAVAAAQRAVGLPYAWGQAGPGAFDCSGLVQWAYAQAGVALPRTSQQQAAAGRPVSLKEARPGDIVVYRDDASHVGLYVGDQQIVHAPYPGSAVRYDPVDVMAVSAVVRP